ncbi:MAG: hypothetical protein A2563_01675 [Candidatus Magasanikbacteria bacterium RIFOXYD1_FULL_40_23]|uniref:DNA 3'-5' helicase n=1 Tax=Candidatus Magasanikbacteria bacterium RIFOXYD1_FULL_40_23 TaxID=1798705 RepID=A0A1F6PAV9_9BACT|nr:MAG: hypothetical protein A2563_01675 [Candidatus Magasanikbacteria bacterium RIFOXYD1_FULL_40_23]
MTTGSAKSVNDAVFLQKYKKLNEQQKLAVDTIEGAVLVIAGPGSGKTELLSLRVANILQKGDVYPSNILCLTFTDFAAKNMSDRLSALIGVDAHRVAIHTFHSFALNIKNRFQENFYEAQKMNASDELIQIETLSEILATLPLSDALSKKDATGAYFYLNSIKDRIGKLKKAGITPLEYQKILNTNSVCYKEIEKILIPAFQDRISKSLRDELPKIIAQIDAIKTPSVPVDHSSLFDYKELLMQSLSFAYEKSVEENGTKSLTVWKDEWLKKDSDTKELHLKDAHQLERNISLAQVYKIYQEKMLLAGYVDFDDMIMDLLRVLHSKKGILSQLQEQYQYILVDEFQDTNDAQMRIINLLADNSVNENNPNIMVVGDDDQAVYKFQGAEINNILQFKKQYPKAKIITLSKNYRSTKEIVDFSQIIISQGDVRLTNQVKEIEKKLEAANPNIAEGAIVAHTFDTALHEYAYVATEIKNKIDSGVNPDDIAVIARNHYQLEMVSTYLETENIPIKYEKQRNILNEPQIQQLISLARLVESISSSSTNYQNDLLPIVLSFPFWEIERQTIWQLSIDASKTIKSDKNGRWIDVMLAGENAHLKNIANWLLTLAGEAQTDPLDSMFDKLIGPEEEMDSFSSPFRRFYFSKEKYEQNPRAYLQFLSSLNTFKNTISLYGTRTNSPRLASLVACVDVYQKNNLAITDTSPYLSGTNAVSLLTAHKAKGSEFDTVFVVNCQNDVWAKSQGRDMIAFPKNLPIDPSGDTLDDFLRIFFVALTRAKRHLYVTSYIKEENGKDSLQIPFLEPSIFADFDHKIDAAHQKMELLHTIKTLEKNILPKVGPIATDERPILQPLLDNYIMSVTHLNNFLDVEKGGPHHFFEQNFLRFPQAKSAHTSYGTAMHETMQGIYNYIKSTGKKPSLSKAQEIFKEKLVQQAMSEQDFKNYLEEGNSAWKVYIEKVSDRFDPSHWIETDFRTQSVMIENVQITGKIDKIVPNEQDKVLEVYDFKTGKPQKDWNGKNEIKKIQLHNYKRQLVFYKLLVEGSRDFHKYRVNNGYLEFLNPASDEEMVVLPYVITSEDVERLKKLIQAVYNKIQALDFLDVNKYEPTLEGMLQFEDDLINGVV